MCGPDEASPIAFTLVGRLAARYPILKFEQSDQLSLEEIFGPRKGQRGGMFALQVEGDSMRDEGILDGDYVIVERRDTARNGERVVALLPDGETTLKTFFRQPEVTLHSAVELLLEDMLVAKNRALVMHSEVTVTFFDLGNGYEVRGADGELLPNPVGHGDFVRDYILEVVHRLGTVAA